MPEPVSEPLFGRAIALVEDFVAVAPTMTLEELRILETTLKREIGARRATIAADLRRKGYSWTEVGRALAISGQRAHAAYSAAEQPASASLD